MPDWVDSSQQWTFDSMLDAIQVSAAQLGFTLVAYDLPDMPGSGDDVGDKAPRSVHESVPGSVLFRHVDAPEENGKPLPVQFLLILLVRETTTLGVHPRTLANALDLALEWNAAVATPSSADVAGRRSRAQSSLRRCGNSGPLVLWLGAIDQPRREGRPRASSTLRGCVAALVSDRHAERDQPHESGHAGYSRPIELRLGDALRR